MPEALLQLQRGNNAAMDLAQAAIGMHGGLYPLFAEPEEEVNHWGILQHVLTEPSKYFFPWVCN